MSQKDNSAEAVTEDGLCYRLFRPEEDKEEVTRFIMRHYVKMDPTARALGLDRDEKSAEIFCKEGLIHFAVQQPICSYVVHDVGTKELVGFRLCRLVDLQKEPIGLIGREEDVAEIFLKGGDGLRTYGVFMDKLLHGVMFLIPKTCTRIGQSAGPNVRPDYLRRGIATRLAELSIDRARRLGAHGFYVMTVAIASQRLYDKLGFEKLKIVHYKYFVNDKGQQMINCDDGTDRGIAHFTLF